MPARIVVIDWSAIGDLVILSPCIRALAAAYPDAHLAVLGRPASIAVYKHHPAVRELIPYDRSQGDWHLPSYMQALHQLRAGRFDLAYLFHNSFGSALMARLAGIPQRIGYRFEGRDFLLTGKVKLPEERLHLLEIKANLLRVSGIDVPEPLVEELYIDEAQAGVWTHDKLGTALGRDRPLVGVSVGSTMENRRWPGASLAEFLNRFPVNSVDFVFVGTPAEKPLFEGVYSYNNTVIDLVGQTTIEELAWVLDRVDLFVGPDSGPIHIAVARQRPVVALFGATDPRRCGPHRYEKATVIRSESICPACATRHGKHAAPCLHTVSADEVYSAASELLKRYSNWAVE